jgi:hypothetical protein
MNFYRENKKMGVPPGNRLAGLLSVPERYVPGADTRGRQEGRPYQWSQQVIYGISRLQFTLSANGMKMGIFIRGKACPKCGGIERHRIRRSFWMRFLPGSRYYLCEHCEVKFFSVLDLVSINWPFRAVA